MVDRADPKPPGPVAKAAGKGITFFFLFCIIGYFVLTPAKLVIETFRTNTKVSGQKEERVGILEQSNEQPSAEENTIIRDALTDLRLGEEIIKDAARKCVSDQRILVKRYKDYSEVTNCIKNEAAALEELRVSVVYLTGISTTKKSGELISATGPLIEGILDSVSECIKIARNNAECKRIEQETLAKLDPTKNDGCMKNRKFNSWHACDEFSEDRLGFTSIMKRPVLNFGFRKGLPSVVQRHFGRDNPTLDLLLVRR